MSKQGGSLDRGRRLRHEVPEVPDADSLTPLEEEAQRCLSAVVDRSGGRFDSKTRIPLEHLEVFSQLFDVWARRHGERTGDGYYFAGNPGLWHALDQLYPLQDPNRWDPLRREVIRLLEARHWKRRSAPRGSSFDIAL